MKKKNQIISEELKMPQLFREDLISIEKIITEELEPREYKLETTKYEYEKVDLIPKDNDAVTEFHIQTHSPYISIDFNRSSARVYADDDDLKTIGALNKILEILKNRERKFFFWSSKIAVWVAPILFFAQLQAIIELGGIMSVKQWEAFSISLLAAIWWAISFYSSLYRFSIINFASLKEKPNFFQRNKDQIALIVFGAFLGAIFTMLIQNIF